MAANLEEFDSVPELHRVWITEDTVEKVAGKLHGSAGLTGLDSFMMKEFLLKHGQASRNLRSAVANLASWLANENVPWAAYRGLMMCREVALDKMPGVRPLGIGDILQRLIAKCVLEAAGLQATEVDAWCVAYLLSAATVQELQLHRLNPLLANTRLICVGNA